MLFEGVGVEGSIKSSLSSNWFGIGSELGGSRERGAMPLLRLQ